EKLRVRRLDDLRLEPLHSILSDSLENYPRHFASRLENRFSRDDGPEAHHVPIALHEVCDSRLIDRVLRNKTRIKTGDVLGRCDQDMQIRRDEPLLELRLKAIHHRENHDHSGHAQANAKNGEQGDKAQELRVLFGLQITKSDPRSPRALPEVPD